MLHVSEYLPTSILKFKSKNVGKYSIFLYNIDGLFAQCFYPPKKVGKFAKKNNINIIGSSNHAGAGFAFMGSLLLHHSDRCMDALVLSNDQIQMRDVKQKQL